MNMDTSEKKSPKKQSRLWQLLRSKRLWATVLTVSLGLLVVWQLTPISEEEVARNEVIVEQRTWYELRSDTTVVLTAADVVGDSLLADITPSDTAQPASRVSERPGYWVNRFRRFPSCLGRIVVASPTPPSPLVEADSAQLQHLIRRQADHVDDALADLVTQQNELHYYRRTHSVQDYGYQAIASYSVAIDRRVDSLRAVLRHLHTVMTHRDHLSLHRVVSYRLLRAAQGGHIYNKECTVWHDDADGYTVVQLPNHHTPVGIITHMSIGDGWEAVRRHAPRPTPKLSKHADRTLRDSLGIYTGQLDSLRRPSGYGHRVGFDGAYYEGHFTAGQLDGFGFYIAPRAYLQAGEWRAGVFKGEKLTYNRERIYGIDVSRHQHERDGKYYPIHWDRLRITDLGTLSSKRVQGKVDYPVSFAYIKSTEGCTVFSDYYDTDYASARKAGIRTGTYHFFSLTTSGADQARHFLAKSHYQQGDLPPVLDVEPTDWQIKQAGGPEAMFTQVRAWLRVVQKQWQVSPILYIGQSFALKYMPLAPDLGDNYFVWIARYGEYMPHFKLTYWQLSPDGRVRGIEGDVDINVYNGYTNQYQQFLERHAKK